MAPPKGCLKCGKAFLVIYNLIFLLCGAAVLALGVWMHFDHDAMAIVHIFQGTEDSILYEKIAFVFIGVGGGVLLVSFLGCCGAVSESICFLCLYSFLLLIIILCEATCAILLSVYKDDVKDLLKTTMRHQVSHEFNATASPSPDAARRITHVWNNIQTQMKCCGTLGVPNYKSSAWLNHTPPTSGVHVPDSCCVLSPHSDDDSELSTSKYLNWNMCQAEAPQYPSRIRSQYVHLAGCYPIIVSHFERHNDIVIAVTVAVIILQVLCFLFTCCTMSCVRRRQAESPWFEDEEEEEE